MLADWDVVTGSVHRGPNSQIFQGCGAEEMRTVCASEPLSPSQRQRWANLTDSQGNRSMSICTEILCGSSERPGQGHSLAGKPKLLSIFPAAFPTVKHAACLFLNSWKKRMRTCYFSVTVDTRIGDCCLSTLCLTQPVLMLRTFCGLLLVIRPSLGVSQKCL